VSRLLLIRHGQASFGAADYDVLSDRGVEQSRMLGAYLAERGTPIDALYRGPRKRHLDTTRHMCEAATAAGRTLPEPIDLEGLDEYPAFELLRYWMPQLRERHPTLADALVAGSPRAIEEITQMWARGELETGELASFAAFEDWVSAAIDQIRGRHGRGVTIAAVTSGGPIAVAVKRCLELQPDMAIAVAWVVNNASITELAFSGERLGLIGLNRIPHLPESLITRR
jgi:broad specificity phosphatase PhoE